MSWKNDYIKVADQLYRDRNPDGKMSTPNGVYITVEKWWHEFCRLGPHDIDFYDWCLKEKEDKNEKHT